MKCWKFYEYKKIGYCKYPGCPSLLYLSLIGTDVMKENQHLPTLYSFGEG